MLFRKSVLILFLIICSVLSGCTYSDSKNEKIIENDCRYGSFSHEKKSVLFETENCCRFLPEGFAITEHSVYYVLETEINVGEEDIENTQASDRNNFGTLHYSLVLADRDLKNKRIIFESDDRCVEYVVGYKDKEAKEGICVLLSDDEHYYVKEYDTEGDIINEAVATKSDLKSDLVSKICRLTNGGYLLYGGSTINCIDTDGSFLTGTEISKLHMSCIECYNDNVYVSYYDDKRCYLAELDAKTLTFGHGISIEGNGSPLVIMDDGTILTIAKDKIISIAPENGETENLFDLSGFIGMDSDRILTFYKKHDEFWFIIWPRESAIGNVPQVVSFIKKNGEEGIVEAEKKKESDIDEYGRTIVKLYDPYGIAEISIGYLIKEYNQFSEQYRVELIREPSDPSLLIAASDAPDLIFLSDVSGLRKFYDQGFLEDLVPYLEKSEKLSVKDIQKYVFQLFGGNEGELYGVTNACGIQVIAGKRSQIGDRQTWTVDEFLSWLESDPEIFGTSQLSPMNMFDYCFFGNLNKYVDFEKGEAKFTQDDFKMLAQRIKNLKFKQKEFPTTGLDADNDDRLLITMGTQTMKWIGRMRFKVGDEITVMSYPNDEGSFVSFLSAWDNLAILSKGSQKDGAYDFIEFFLLRDEKTSAYQEAVHESCAGLCYSVNRMFEHEKELVLGEYETKIHVTDGPGGSEIVSYIEKYEITRKDVELMQHMLDVGIAESAEATKIRVIVYSEMDSYLKGERDLETTCKMIQSRVQLMLDEGK